jgi:hypothetical protein
MVLYEGAGLLLLLALWIFCLVDVITCDESECRNLPKMMWLLIVLVLPDVGSVLWLVAGRPQGRGRPAGLPYKGNTGRPQGQPSHRDHPSQVRAANPDDDEEFLRGIRNRAEEQRRIAREQQERRDPGSEPEHRREDDPDAR